METVDWGYVITTLVLRYSAIFIVLTMLIVLLTINGKIVSTLANRKRKAKTTAAPERSDETPPPAPGEDPHIPVAIGTALGLYNNSRNAESDPGGPAEEHSEWKMAGRVAQWKQKPGGS